MKRSISLRAAGLVFVIVWGASACRSEDPHVRQRNRLANAERSLESRDYPRAKSALEKLLVETGSRPREFRLQRAYAALMLAELNTRASLGAPAVASQPQEAAVVDASTGRSGRAIPSVEVGHAVAAVAWSIYGADWLGAGSDREEDPTKLLPEQAESFDAGRARAHLDYCLLTLYARLGFRDSMRRIVDARAELLKLVSCEPALEDARVNASVRPWVLYAMHVFLKDADPPESYKFAVRALERGSESLSTIRSEQVRQMEGWITDNEYYVFRCPNCRDQYVPGGPNCVNGCTSYLNFFGDRRPGDAGFKHRGR